MPPCLPDRAAKAARGAFVGEWSRWKPYDRQRLLIKVHDLIDRHFEELALLETLDMGAPPYALTTLNETQTRYEFECYDTSHLYNLHYFWQEGLVQAPPAR